MSNERSSLYSWRLLLKRAAWLLLIPLGLLLPRIAAGSGTFIEEVYSARLYPLVKDALLLLFRRIPFSFAELLFYVLCALVPLMLIVWIVRAVRRRDAKPLIKHLITLGILFGVGLNLFYVTWGFNYFRAPLSERLGLELRPRDVSELSALVSDLAEEAGALRAEVSVDEAGLAAYTGTGEEAFDALLPAYSKLAKRMPAFSGRVCAAKPVFFSKGMSAAGISGIYIGLTAEANVNVDQPAFSVPAAAAHEMAHQLGVASEDAAEFTAFLACRESDDPLVRYSGCLQMLIRAGNRLYETDPEAYRDIRETYAEGVLLDMIAQSAYWERYDGPVEEFVDDMNDGYLKHNAQPSGVKSYGEAVDLLLAWHEDQKNF